MLIVAPSTGVLWSGSSRSSATRFPSTHLHLFHVRNPETGQLESIGIPDDEPYLDEPLCLAGWDVPIARYFAKEGDAASYAYDFGDDWRHTVVLEGVDTIQLAS